MRILPVKLDTDFHWNIPHLYQITTKIIELVLIIIFKASEVCVMMLLKFLSLLMKKKHFDLHVFSREHEKIIYIFFFVYVEATVKRTFTFVFTYTRDRNITTTTYVDIIW